MQRHTDCVGDHQQGVQPRGVDAPLDVADRAPSQVDEFAESLLGEVGMDARIPDLLADPPAPRDDVIGNWIKGGHSYKL